jgi:hypothetical protein
MSFEDPRVRGRIGLMASWQMITSSICFALGILIAVLSRSPEGLVLSALAAASLWWWYPMYKAAQGEAPPDGPSVDELVAQAEADHRAGRIDQAEFQRRIDQAWGSTPPPR